MKTDNVYIAELACSSKIENHGTLEDYFGKGIYNRVYYHPIKYIIVKKDPICSNMAIDLVTKKKYLCELPCTVGVLHLPRAKMIPFDALFPDAKRNLPKKKILEMGKQVIEEIYKAKEEEKKK